MNKFDIMKVLLLGGNGFGFEHANSYRRLGTEFSVFSRNKDVLSKYKNNYDVRSTFTDINEAINSDYDMVDIVLPHTIHREYTEKAMNRGKHVLVEKPIADSFEDAKAMISSAEKNRVKFMVAEQYFFDSSARYTLNAIKNGKVGELLTVIVRSQQLFKKQGWRTTEKLMGGGGLIDGGIHYMQTFLDFGGSFSDMYSIVNKGKSSIEGEDNSVALFRFKSGSAGIFYYSWAYANPPSLPAYEVVGTEGTIYESNLNRNSQKRTSYGKPVLNGNVQDIEEIDVIDAEISGFMNAIERDMDVPYSPGLALRNLEVIIDIYKKKPYSGA